MNKPTLIASLVVSSSMAFASFQVTGASLNTLQNGTYRPLGSASYLDFASGRNLPGRVRAYTSFNPPGTQVGESGQCVALVKELSGAPQTSLWLRGARVVDSLDSLPVGTAIATFNSSRRYDSGHTAIYLGRSGSTIFVADQNWGAQCVRKHEIRYTRTGTVSDAGRYYVIER